MLYLSDYDACVCHQISHETSSCAHLKEVWNSVCMRSNGGTFGSILNFNDISPSKENVHSGSLEPDMLTTRMRGRILDLNDGSFFGSISRNVSASKVIDTKVVRCDERKWKRGRPRKYVSVVAVAGMRAKVCASKPKGTEYAPLKKGRGRPMKLATPNVMNHEGLIARPHLQRKNQDQRSCKQRIEQTQCRWEKNARCDGAENDGQAVGATKRSK